MNVVNVILVFLVGLCVGSFINVCIYRMPRKISLIKRRSFCVHCEETIPLHYNIPLISWPMIQGRCRRCKQKVAIRYPLIELFTALLFLASWVLLPAPEAIIGMVFLSILIVASFIDYEHTMIPDRLTMGGFGMGILLMGIVPNWNGSLDIGASVDGVFQALMGGLIGSGILLWVALLSERMMSREGLGLGDIKFMGCIGAFCGWKGAVFTIFGGAVLGSFLVLPFLLWKHGKPCWTKAVPFGPFLAAAGAAYYLGLKSYIDPFFQFL